MKGAEYTIKHLGEDAEKILGLEIQCGISFPKTASSIVRGVPSTAIEFALLEEENRGYIARLESLVNPNKAVLFQQESQSKTVDLSDSAVGNDTPRSSTSSACSP